MSPPFTMPTRGLERLREAAILEAKLEEGEGVVMCVGHPARPEHPADWYARCPCGHPAIPVCNQRRERARHADGMHCGGRGGCGSFHSFVELEFVRI